MLAQDTDQTLGENPFDRARDQVGLDTHIDQSRERTRGIIRVKRAEHKVTCERGLNCRFGRFTITNFPDQNDIRVVTQDTSKAGGECQPHL